MPVAISATRTFICDVADCPSRLVVQSNAAAEPLPNGWLPEGWHHHIGLSGGEPEETRPQQLDIHCGKHWYRWDSTSESFEAVPRIKRPRKSAGEDGGK